MVYNNVYRVAKIKRKRTVARYFREKFPGNSQQTFAQEDIKCWILKIFIFFLSCRLTYTKTAICDFPPHSYISLEPV